MKYNDNKGMYFDNIIYLPGEPMGRYVQPPTHTKERDWCSCMLHMAIYLPL